MGATQDRTICVRRGNKVAHLAVATKVMATAPENNPCAQRTHSYILEGCCVNRHEFPEVEEATMHTNVIDANVALRPALSRRTR